MAAFSQCRISHYPFSLREGVDSADAVQPVLCRPKGRDGVGLVERLGLQVSRCIARQGLFDDYGIEESQPQIAADPGFGNTMPCRQIDDPQIRIAAQFVPPLMCSGECPKRAQSCQPEIEQLRSLG